MRKEDKTVVIEELKEKFQNNQTFYVMDASGMSVAKTNAFRRLCFTNGLDYKVYKNTLIKQALSSIEGDYAALDESLRGFSGIIFSGEIANAPAKVVREFRKKQGSDKPTLKAASIESEFFLGEENLTTLSELKSKNELIGEIIGLLQSPAKNVISALQASGGRKVAGLVKALAEREN